MVDAAAPTIDVQPVGGTFERGEELVLSWRVRGTPAPTFTWQKDGVEIAGATSATLRIDRAHPFDAGTYRAFATNAFGQVASNSVEVTVTIDLDAHSVARWWIEFLLDGIRKDFPNPPVHARNLYHLSSGMWDAFWPYEVEGWSRAVPAFHREDVLPADWIGGREGAQRQAICHAAYRVLTERFKNSPGRVRTLLGFRWLMQEYGYDPDFTGTTGNDPASVGNRIGYAVLAASLHDGANEANGYVDATGYAPRNDPMIVALAGNTMLEPDYWQPLALAFSVTQNGIPLGEAVQRFVGVNARNTRPFAVLKPTSITFESSVDPGPPPRFGTATHAAFVQEAVDCILRSSMLDPADGVTIDISPGALFKNPLGTNDGTGYPVNPVTDQPYAANVVLRGDYARVLAEFWADGPASETPPGHWNTVYNDVTDHPLFRRRYAGTGPELAPLEWDVRSYFALNGAVHDAACVAWGAKRIYDSARPISMIRYLASLGQSSDPAGPSYHALGLPLMPGLIEVITPASAAAGQRHEHLAAEVGQIAIRAWQGKPANPLTEIGGVGWILASTWVPYQLETFVSPAFPGYISGHSTFSRAAAEVLTLLTGSPYFPGGLAEYHFPANQYLRFELGPTTDVALQWATYYDASDQAGLSRIFGGIHPSADDFPGRQMGSRVGLKAFLKAQLMRNASAPEIGVVNVSTRGRAGDGDDVMIAGFVIDGADEQSTLLRVVGPTLEDHGIAPEDCDVDPRFDVFRQGESSPFLTNGNWTDSANIAAITTRAQEVGAFPLRSGSTDAAELASLPPGTYTVVSRSSDPDARGIALAEVYGRSLANISTRGRVEGGEGALIAGFVVNTLEPGPLLIRGIGPGLADHGVAGVLADPILHVYRHEPDGSTTLIGTSDNWSDDDRASLTTGAAVQTGAFPLTAGSADAALFVQLPGGTYSAVVQGANGTAGVALVEVYRVK